MSRKYELRKRAEKREETRRRIVEAAIGLHASIGPARTTISGIAERAGVQRHTVYAHFPDERELHVACSGLYLSRNPLPDPAPWREVADPQARLRRGIGDLYEWFAANEAMLSRVVADAETHVYTREMAEAQIGPVLAAMVGTLAEPFRARGNRRRRLLAAIQVAVDFRTWQTLVRGSALSRAEAVETAVGMISCQ